MDETDFMSRGGSMQVLLARAPISIVSNLKRDDHSKEGVTFCWISFISCCGISSGSLLYTQINQNALRILICKKWSLQIFSSYLLCRPVPDFVQWRCAVDSLHKLLFFISAALCSNPIIAISRQHARGAMLKLTSASFGEIPNSLKNLCWKLCKGANVLP